MLGPIKRDVPYIIELATDQREMQSVHNSLPPVLEHTYGNVYFSLMHDLLSVIEAGFFKAAVITVSIRPEQKNPERIL